MISLTRPLTVEEFLALPETDTTYELIDERAVPKMSPKFFHSRLQKTLLFLLERYLSNQGRIEAEWAVRLKRNGKDWVPVPDLLYVSYERLPQDWMKDEPCPLAPELALEIISPGQSFGDLTLKASDYLKAGVLRVWVIDPIVQSLSIFYPDTAPQTIKGAIVIDDEIFPDLKLSVEEIFRQAGLNARGE